MCLFLCSHHAVLITISVVLSDIWDGYGSYFVLFLQDCFGNLKNLMAPYKF